MACLCAPKSLSADLPELQQKEELLPDESFNPVDSYAQEVSSLCQQISEAGNATAVSLGKKTVAADASVPGENVFSAWRKEEMRPTKVHTALPSNDTAVGMAQLASDWSLVDHIVLGHLARKNDPPKPDYFPGSLLMAKCGDSTVVYTVSGQHKKLQDGTLKLHKDAYVIFDQTCSDVEIKNVTIEGGFIACSGKGCSVRFTNVTFKNSCLIAMSGAKVALSNTHFSNETMHFVSLISKDSGSKVIMNGGSITGGENGAHVNLGATLEISNATFDAILSVGVKAETKSSVLRLNDVTLKNFHSIKKLHRTSEEFTTGLFLRNKCSATLQNVTVQGVDVGCFAHNSTMELIACKILGSLEKGAQIKGGASFNATGCEFSDTGPGPTLGVFSGLVAHDNGTSAVLNKCTFNRNQESAVTILGGPAVIVEDCTAEGNLGINSRERKGDELKPAFCVIGSGKMTVKNTSITGKTEACSKGVKKEGVKLNGLSLSG